MDRAAGNPARRIPQLARRCDIRAPVLPRDAAATMLRQDATNLAAVSSADNTAAIQDVARTMKRARRTVILTTGSGTGPAQILQYLASIGGYDVQLAVGPATSQAVLVSQLNEGDCLVVLNVWRLTRALRGLTSSREEPGCHGRGSHRPAFVAPEHRRRPRRHYAHRKRGRSSIAHGYGRGRPGHPRRTRRKHNQGIDWPSRTGVGRSGPHGRPGLSNRYCRQLASSGRSGQGALGTCLDHLPGVGVRVVTGPHFVSPTCRVADLPRPGEYSRDLRPTDEFGRFHIAHGQSTIRSCQQLIRDMPTNHVPTTATQPHRLS